jgi:hypothetical protein
LKESARVAFTSFANDWLLKVAKPMLKKVLLSALLALSFYIFTAGARAVAPC